MNEEHQLLRFQPFNSTVNVAFWHRLAEKKLDEFKLSEDSIPLFGHYAVGNTIPSQFELDGEAFNKERVNSFDIFVQGKLINTNTLESFKELDKTSVFNSTAQEIWNDIVSEEALKNPAVLGKFLLITFADLKNYRFYYWFAFPALSFPISVTAKPAQPLSSFFSEEEISQLREGHSNKKFPGFFLIRKSSSGVFVGFLHEWNNFWKEDDEHIVGYVDPCSLDSHPGWPLRNFLMLIAKNWKFQQIKVVCYREKHGQTSASSIVLEVQLPEVSFENCPSAVGWEKNHKSKHAPRFVNLASSMDLVAFLKKKNKKSQLTFRKMSGSFFSYIQIKSCIFK